MKIELDPLPFLTLERAVMGIQCIACGIGAFLGLTLLQVPTAMHLAGLSAAGLYMFRSLRPRLRR